MQGLTAATASALVLLASSLELWCGRRRAAELAPTMACGGTAAAAARAEGGGRDAGNRMERGFWGRGSASRPGGWRWPAAARPTPAYGRHVAGAGWSEAGAARAGERGGGAGCAVQLGRKGGGSAQ